VDLTRLNDNVERVLHPMPVVEHTLGQLSGAKVFSKLDANSGFWQIQLAEESRKLTTFITPFGRFCFKRLPFGISSAPEPFQKRMTELLRDQTGVVCHLDDILIFAATVEEHNRRLRAVLQRLKTAGVTLNSKKCVFGTKQIQFLGHKIDENRIHPDDSKVEAVVKMPAPTNVAEVRRFRELANYLGRFMKNLLEVSQPLNELLSTKSEFVWGPGQ